MHVEKVRIQMPPAVGPGGDNSSRLGPGPADAASSKAKATDADLLSDEASQAEHSEQAANGEKTGAPTGVLRLLQQGHFKGVADIRLRINFHDQLAAIETAQLRAVADEKVGDLAESVVPYIRDLVEKGQITEELANTLVDGFTQKVNQCVEAFLVGQTSTKEALAGELTSTFKAFVASLAAMTDQSVQTSAESAQQPEIVGDILEQVAGDTTAQAQPAEQSPDITAAFETALEQFLAELNNVRLLPELSGPQGKGAVYQKFLNIYNELQSPASEGTPAEADSVDIVT